MYYESLLHFVQDTADVKSIVVMTCVVSWISLGLIIVAIVVIMQPVLHSFRLYVDALMV